MKRKYRIVELSGYYIGEVPLFVPQIKINHFLYGYHWESIEKTERSDRRNGFRTWNSTIGIVDRCGVSKEAAEEIIIEYESYRTNIAKLL